MDSPSASSPELGFLPLFVAAGAVTLPTVVGGGLALSRVEWHRLTRVICLLAATGPLVFVASDLVGSFGWSLHTVAGFLTMLGIYATIISATRFTVAAQTDGWRLNRWAKVVILVILGLVVALLVVAPITA